MPWPHTRLRSFCRLSCFLLLFGLAGATTPVLASAETPLEVITVTAARREQPLSDVPANVTVIDTSDIRRSASRTIDDLLRSLPGFSLFRRSSSLVANPPSQGVSLRGVGPSAVSRTLVLLDGVPLNDPFGGWIYWSRVPMETIERIEVVRGGGSSVWGNSAMGGVINILTARPDRNRVSASAEGGNHGTRRFQALASSREGRVGMLLDGDYFHTDGYFVLGSDRRGAIDTPIDSEHGSLGALLEYDITPALVGHVRARYFSEHRHNGTHYTDNGTDTAFLRAGLKGRGSGDQSWNFDVFFTDQHFDSTFSSQAADRSSEQPALDQFDVPSRSVGTSFMWTGNPAAHHSLSVGSDASWTEGETNEDTRYVAGRFTKRRRAGSEQVLAGAYVQDLYAPSERWSVAAAARVDYWRSAQGFRRERDLVTGLSLNDDGFASRDEVIFSPKLGAVYRATDNLSLRASFYQGFRAPTINELYRPFRVRNDITESNPALDIERLTGVDAGVDYFSGRWNASLGFYWNRVEDTVANVTVAPGPGPVAPCGFVPDGGLCRQKMNLDRSRILGLEAEVGLRPFERVSVTGRYLFSDTEILRADANSDIEGNRIPQVPLHQATLAVGYEPISNVSVNLQVRYTDDQYEDDLNSRKLGVYTVVDAMLSWRPARSWELFVAAENLFGTDYAVGESSDGRVTLGAPTLVHAGLRYEVGGELEGVESDVR